MSCHRRPLPLSSRSRKREDRDRAQITAYALNHQPQDNMLIRGIIEVLSLLCVFIPPVCFFFHNVQARLKDVISKMSITAYGTKCASVQIQQNTLVQSAC